MARTKPKDTMQELRSDDCVMGLAQLDGADVAPPCRDTNVSWTRHWFKSTHQSWLLRLLTGSGFGLR